MLATAEHKTTEQKGRVLSNQVMESSYSYPKAAEEDSL
jgi:hypothetical protein